MGYTEKEIEKLHELVEKRISKILQSLLFNEKTNHKEIHQLTTVIETNSQRASDKIKQLLSNSR